MSGRFSQSMIDFILAGILFFAATILFGICIFTAIAVFNSNSLANKTQFESSNFFQVSVQNYRKIPREVDVKFTTKEAETYFYWLAYSENNDIFIIETTSKIKPIIGNNVLASYLQTGTKNVSVEIIKDAELLDFKVTESIQIYSLSSQEEYQKSWVSYLVSSVFVGVTAAVFLFSGIMAKKQSK